MSEEKLDSFFSEGIVLKGNLKFKGLLRFDGDFEGSIETKDTLIVGESGKVKADIKSGKLFNFGKIDGDVNARYKIHLYSKSHLNGDIEAPVVVMEETSFFQGACKMPPAPKDMPKESAPVAKKESPKAPPMDTKPAGSPTPAGKKGGGWFGLLISIVSMLAGKAA